MRIFTKMDAKEAMKKRLEESIEKVEGRINEEARIEEIAGRTEGIKGMLSRAKKMGVDIKPYRSRLDELINNMR